MGKVHDALLKHEADKKMASLSGRLVTITSPTSVTVQVWVAGGDKKERNAFMEHCGVFLKGGFKTTWGAKVQLGKFTNPTQFRAAPMYVFTRSGKVTKVI